MWCYSFHTVVCLARPADSSCLFFLASTHVDRGDSNAMERKCVWQHLPTLDSNKEVCTPEGWQRAPNTQIFPLIKLGQSARLYNSKYINNSFLKTMQDSKYPEGICESWTVWGQKTVLKMQPRSIHMSRRSKILFQEKS